MILQVIFDDKFGDYAIEQFQRYQDKNHFVLVTSGKGEIQYVKKLSAVDVIVYYSPEYHNLIAHLSDYKAVIVHGLFSYIQYHIVRQLPKETTLAWVLWGAEIYSREDTQMQRLAPITKCLAAVKKMKDTFNHVKKAADEVPIEILNRVDYVLCSSLEVYEDAKAYIGNPNMKHLQFSYFTLERLIGEELMDKTVSGNNILLGNSAAVENNHADILLRLKRVGIPKDSKLITPLSYNTPWVREIISKAGRWLFKQQFYPLLSFMHRTEYNQLVQSCSVFIANHHNPNAFGNVLTALWLGARVYSSKDNVQTKFLQRLGLHVNVIESDLSRRNPNQYSQLSEKEREENRAIIRKTYGMEQMQKNIDRIIRTLDA